MGKSRAIVLFNRKTLSKVEKLNVKRTLAKLAKKKQQEIRLVSTIESKPKFIFTSIQPAVGSDVNGLASSTFTITSMIGSEESPTLLGMDAVDAVCTADYESILKTHVRKLRKIPNCKDAVLVCDIDAGTGLEANHVYTLIQNNESNVILMADSPNRAGTRMTQSTHDKMKEMGRNVPVTVYQHFVTHFDAPEEMLRDLQGELKSRKVDEDQALGWSYKRCLFTMHHFQNAPEYERFQC